MRLGLVGAGRWGKRYIATIAQLQDVHLAHLVSSNPESAALVPGGCRLSPDWRAATADPTLDGIILATPPSTHTEMALAAIANGTPVLIEKPMTLSVEEANSLVDQSNRAGVLVMVGHTHLYGAAFRELKSRSAALGELIQIRSSGGSWGPFRSDTPVLWDWGPHDVAMCLELFSAMPARVESKRVAFEKTSAGTGEAIEITLYFEPGGQAQVRLSNLEQRKQRYLEAKFSGGVLIYDDLASKKLVFRSHQDVMEQEIPLDGSLPLANEVREFCRLIGSRARADHSLDLGFKVVQVLAACQSRLDSADARANG